MYSAVGVILGAVVAVFALALVGCGSNGSPSPSPLAKQLTIGTPGVSFRRVAAYVLVRAMERLGYTVTLMDNEPHRLEYPKFTEPNAPIDIFTGSDLPWNHAPWLSNYTDTFYVVGTVNEATDILLGVPSYVGTGSVSEFIQQKDAFTTSILSLDTNTCPACVKQSQQLADAISSTTKNFTVSEFSPGDFISTVTSYINKQVKFIVCWYVPCWIVGQLPEMKMLHGDKEPFTKHNVGKTIIRRDRMNKLDTNAMSVLSAVFVGNDAITQMDTEVNKNGKTPKAAADGWIASNSVIFNSFFTQLPLPALPVRPGATEVS